MIELTLSVVGVIVLAVFGCWYCRRWGHADGYAEGYESGRNKGLLERADFVRPSLTSGGPRERA